MYVNLKYRVGSENLHAYFAKQRDEDWMMIELYQFMNQKDDVTFTFLLESFSSYYFGESAIYVEGIEFRAINKVRHENIIKLMEGQQVLKSNFNLDQVQQLPTNFEEIFKIHRNYDELFWLGEVNGKKLLVLSAKATLYKFSDVFLFTSKPSAHSRFQEVLELLPQQVFYVNCTIRSQMLSADTEYGGCIIRPLNINDITRVPQEREDGWMEIQVWKFNSTHEFKDDSLSMNMKFTSHEGTMSGLIVCGLEFRPVLEVKIDGLPLLLDCLCTESDKKRKSGGLQSHFFSKRAY
ncbi:kinase-like domain, phloem protein 2-like protein [Tanacetum coccineum]